MTPTIRRLAAGIATALLTTAGAIGSAHAASAPPWEPDGDSSGGLTFYNAQGHVVTGGSISSTPIAAYVVGSSVLRDGDTKAALFGDLPVKGKAPGEWSGEQLTVATAYPNPGAPAGVSSSLPVVTGSSTDESLATLAADYPNKSTADGYDGVYQLRLYTSAPGRSLTTTYDSADIQISGNSWSVVYSGGATSSGAAKTHTTLTASKASIKAGRPLTLIAKETPAVAGKVAFFDGSKKLATVAVTKGKATYVTKSLKVGRHPIHAVFTPKNTTSHRPSKSKTDTVTVKKP